MRTRLLFVSLALAMNSFAQLRGNLHVTGEVQHDLSINVSELSVELHDRQQPQPVERAPVMHDGSFEIRNGAPGNYEVRLVNRYGDSIRSEWISLNQGRESVTFRLEPPTRKPVSGAVAVSQLEHHVNRKAQHEYDLAAKSLAKADTAASVLHLEKSIEADPEFAAAHHELGVALSAQGQTEQAAREFEQSVTIDPALAMGHSNLAIVLVKLKRFAEAEKEARRALQIEPDIVKAHFVLAVSLLCQQEFGEEALKHLRLAYQEFPQARTLAARLEAQLASTN